MTRAQWNDKQGTFLPTSAIDFLPHSQLHELQLQRLKAITAHSYQHVPLFRQRMEASGLTPDAIQKLEDIRLLPLSSKQDLRDNYPYGLFAVPMNEVVRLHASSGTTGQPIVVGYTAADMDIWSQVVRRTLYAAGFQRSDVVQNCYGYGLFTGGLGLHGGIESLGATVIPISGGNSERQLMVMKDFKVSAICATPSYFIHLIEVANRMGLDFRRDLQLKRGVFGAEPWSEGMRQYIQQHSGIEAYDIYGLSEIIGPGVGAECHCRNGLHIFEDHFLVEILDPDSLEPVADGQEGELVISTLSKQAMPLLRYRTRDISAIEPTPCACGRTLRRIRRITRRSDDMLIVRGVNLFPGQIETALLNVASNLPHYQIVLTRQAGLDKICVQVEQANEMSSEARTQLLQHIAHSLFQVTGLHMDVSLMASGSLPRSEGKARRLLDLRANN